MNKVTSLPPDLRTSVRRQSMGRAAATHADVAAIQIEDERATDWWGSIYRGLASWMVSTLVHLFLMITLAVITFGVAGRQTISLEMDATKPVDSMVMLDVVIDAPDPNRLAVEIPEPAATSLSSELDESNLVLSEVVDTYAPTAISDPYQSISGAGVDDSLLDEIERLRGSGAQFFGIKGVGSRFVFIIDCSGSMDEYRRWKRAVRELKRSINNLVEPQQFLVLLYNSQCYTMNDRPPGLVPASAENQRNAIRWLARQEPLGSTYVAQALENAFELKPDAIFLLSDGEFDDLQMVWTVLAHYNGVQNGGVRHRENYEAIKDVIPVHTISLGGKGGAWTMQEIAEKNEGTFTIIDD